MAFFTRVNLNVPVLPPEESLTEWAVPVSSSTATILHRRHFSEPATSQSVLGAGKFGVHNCSAQNCFPSNPVSKSSSVGINSIVQSSAVSKKVTSAISNGDYTIDDTTATNNVKITLNAKGRSCTTVPGPESDQIIESSKSDEPSGDEPKRYEYVVDRVLGVEV